jgi:hypothetical protein
MRCPSLNRQSATGSRKCSGAVATELALLVVFVYLPLVIGAMYVAWMALARGRVHEANHYALHRSGDQSETATERGVVSEEFFREFTGSVTVREGTADDPQVPGPREIRDLFEEYARQYYWTETIIHRHVPQPPRAWGGFTLGGGGVTYEERVEPGCPPREPTIEIRDGWAYAHKRQAREVEQLGLLQDEIPERLTDHMAGFMRRWRTQAIYRHSWAHDADPIVAGRQGERAWNLQVPAPDVSGRDAWSPEGSTRGSKVRQARDTIPPGAWVRSLLQCPSEFPPPEPDTDFMHPK